MHPLLGVTGFTGLDLRGVRDLDGLRAALRDAVPAEDGWVRGFGLDHNAFGGAPITNAVLEETLPGAAVSVVLYDGHSALASATALRRAGVDGPREFGQRSEVVCDEHGVPTGYLLEHGAMALVADVLPPAPYAELRARVLDVFRGMAATGLTGGNMMDAEAGALDVLDRIETTDDLPLRLRVAPWCMPGDDLDELVALQGRHGRRWAVGAVKFFVDGTVEGGTAWLEHADCFGQSTDAFWLDTAEYTKAMHHFAAAGIQTATHAIGDAGVRHVVDSLTGVDTRGVRHRVEHLETLPRDEIVRLVRAGLVASMQPSPRGLHQGRPQRRVVDPARHRTRESRLGVPRRPGRRRRARARLGLADRRVRRTRGPGLRAAASSPRHRRRARAAEPGPDRSDGARGDDQPRGPRRRRRGVRRPGRGRLSRRPDRVRRRPGRRPGRRGGRRAGPVDHVGRPGNASGLSGAVTRDDSL